MGAGTVIDAARRVALGLAIGTLATITILIIWSVSSSDHLPALYIVRYRAGDVVRFYCDGDSRPMATVTSMGLEIVCAPLSLKDGR